MEEKNDFDKIQIDIFKAIQSIEKNALNAISNSKELIATLEQKIEEQEKIIKDLKSELSDTTSRSNSRKKALKEAIQMCWESETKLKKIPKWIQKIFI